MTPLDGYILIISCTKFIFTRPFTPNYLNTFFYL